MTTADPRSVAVGTRKKVVNSIGKKVVNSSDSTSGFVRDFKFSVCYRKSNVIKILKNR